MTAYIIVDAHAKINLTLDVFARRPDGYHDIRSVMQTVTLHDTLEITHVPAFPGVTLTVRGEEATGVPDDGSNIVHRAAVRLQKAAADQGTLLADQSGLHITLIKRIPSQSGLGGGSSDAAAVLRAIDILFGLNLSPSRLTEIAVSLGADVPFFLTGGTALVEGVGERVTPLPPFGGDDSDWHVVIVKPPVGVSTAGAYAALDNIAGRVAGDATARWVEPRSTGQPVRLGNDFQDVVVATHPEIAAAYNAMENELRMGYGPMLSGSGAAVFCLTQGENAAHLLADYVLSARVGKAWVTKIHGRNE